MLNNIFGKCMSRKVFPRIAVKMFHIPRVRLVRLAWWLHVFGCSSYSEQCGDHGRSGTGGHTGESGGSSSQHQYHHHTDTLTPARLVFSQQPPLVNIHSDSTDLTIKILSSSQNLSACTYKLHSYITLILDHLREAESRTCTHSLWQWE